MTATRPTAGDLKNLHHQTAESPLYIAVLGGSAGNSDSEALRLAEEVGRRIAEAGCVLVNGGLGGTMEHGAKGAQLGGGVTLGILPGAERADANQYLDYSIPTHLGFIRNSLVAASGDAVIALPGNWGTLSEIAMARVWNRPVVAMDFWRPLLGSSGIALGLTGVRIAANPKEAVNIAVESAKKRRSSEEMV